MQTGGPVGCSLGRDDGVISVIQDGPWQTLNVPKTGSGECKNQPATIVGTSGNDKRKGTAHKDVIVGLGGNDKLSGLAATT